ncbi:MAG: zonular occludens toxin domain-containing protein [Pseudomonadota bacterium]
MAKDAAIESVFGFRGAGKTTYVKHKTKTETRLFVWDPMEEFGEGDKIKRLSTADIVPTLKRARTRNIRAAYTPGRGQEASHFATLCEALMAMQQAYKDREEGEKITFVVDEADTVYGRTVPNGHPFAELVRRGRHYGIEIIVCTQFPTQIQPDVRRNSLRTVIFPLGDASAMDYVTTFMGKEHREAVRSLQPHNALIYSAGNVTSYANPPLK